jgi:hypothetical protein
MPNSFYIYCPKNDLNYNIDEFGHHGCGDSYKRDLIKEFRYADGNISDYMEIFFNRIAREPEMVPVSIHREGNTIIVSADNNNQAMIYFRFGRNAKYKSWKRITQRFIKNLDDGMDFFTALCYTNNHYTIRTWKENLVEKLANIQRVKICFLL